jgi:hypothetical protein
MALSVLCHDSVMRKILFMGLTAISISLSACSSGGDSAGFCRRWNDVLDQLDSGAISNTEELLSAIEPSNLGDPGGTLSELRNSFEQAIRVGTNTEATQFTDLIISACADIQQ